jgi:hypothetical protein
MLLLVLINVITFTSVDNFNTILWYSQPLEYQFSVFQTLWNTEYYNLVYSNPYEILSIILV